MNTTSFTSQQQPSSLPPQQEPSPSATATRADANRRNAQLSTGPRTDEGKARSSQNAVRSGWFSRDLRVPAGKEELYLEFEQAWHDELQPTGLAELETFNDFLRSSWHKREVIEALNESDLSFLDDDHDESPAATRKLDRLHRYLRDFERRAARALRDLRSLQTARARREAQAAKAESEALQKQTHQPGGKTPPPGIPENVLRTLYIMEIETNHWNAEVRARKAGIVSPSQPPSTETERRSA